MLILYVLESTMQGKQDERKRESGKEKENMMVNRPVVGISGISDSVSWVHFPKGCVKVSSSDHTPAGRR